MLILENARGETMKFCYKFTRDCKKCGKTYRPPLSTSRIGRTTVCNDCRTNSYKAKIRKIGEFEVVLDKKIKEFLKYRIVSFKPYMGKKVLL